MSRSRVPYRASPAAKNVAPTKSKYGIVSISSCNSVVSVCSHDAKRLRREQAHARQKISSVELCQSQGGEIDYQPRRANRGGPAGRKWFFICFIREDEAKEIVQKRMIIF